MAAERVTFTELYALPYGLFPVGERPKLKQFLIASPESRNTFCSASLVREEHGSTHEKQSLALKQRGVSSTALSWVLIGHRICFFDAPYQVTVKGIFHCRCWGICVGESRKEGRGRKREAGVEMNSCRVRKKVQWSGVGRNLAE